MGLKDCQNQLTRKSIEKSKRDSVYLHTDKENRKTSKEIWQSLGHTEIRKHVKTQHFERGEGRGKKKGKEIAAGRSPDKSRETGKTEQECETVQWVTKNRGEICGRMVTVFRCHAGQPVKRGRRSRGLA